MWYAVSESVSSNSLRGDLVQLDTYFGLNVLVWDNC